MTVSGLDLLLLIIYTSKDNTVWGATKLVKLIFLMLYEGGYEKLLSKFDFEAYNFGPWSSKVLDYSELLQDESLIQIETKKPKSVNDYCSQDLDRKIMADEDEIETNEIRVYSLSIDGKKVALSIYQSLSQTDRRKIDLIMRKYSNLSGRDLLEYVYRNYTKYTSKSIIKQDILKSPLDEFKETYPNLEVDPDFFRVIGILPKISLDEEKKLLGELLVERYTD